MALANAWLAANSDVYTNYVTPIRWGDGVSPIHAQRGGDGRQTAVTITDGTVNEAITDEYQPEDYSYCPEDEASVLWGYGIGTGTEERPSLGEEDTKLGDRVETLPGYPSYGRHIAGVPGGSWIRSLDKGAANTLTPKEMQPPAVTVKTAPPVVSYINDAVVSDPSQYIMQTSMVQRDKTREGSQAQAGRESEYLAPIASRITPMRVKNLDAEPSRHGDMFPMQQDLIIRPFWSRTAGTGRTDEMLPNETNVVTPMTRSAPANPYTGSDTVDMFSPLSGGYGYVAEDRTW